MKCRAKYIILIIVIQCTFFCGCTNVSEIENSKLVTACAVRFSGNDVIYKFYVSVPKGQSETENGSGTSGGKAYEFKAGNFSDALGKFRHSVSGKIDLGHVSLFVAEKSYMDQKFRDDYKFIREEVKTTPAMYYCMTMSEDDAIFDYISSECEGNPAVFSENMFQNRNNYLACTATELHFACENKYYTAFVPVVEISGGKSDPIAIHNGAYVYSQVSGTFHVYGNDFATYKLCRKKIYNSEKLYDISINGDKILIQINSATDRKEEICEFAKRYSSIGFDLLNCIYYSKRKFLTYNSYNSYAGNLYAQNLNFIIGGE